MAGVPALVAGGLRGRSRWGVAAALLVLTVAALAIAAGLTVASQGQVRLDEVAAEANVADLVLSGERDALAGLAGDPRLVATAGPFAVASGLDLVLPDDAVELRVTAVDQGDLAVGRPLLRRGRWLAAGTTDEIVLDHSLALELGLAPGDQVRLRFDDRDASFDVVGSAVDLTDCGYPQCETGRAFLSDAGLARLVPSPETSMLLAEVPDPDRADQVFAELQADLGPSLTGAETWPDTRGDLLAVDQTFGRFVTAFGAFVLAAAAVVVAGSTAARVASRRREIGLMGAVGATPRQVTMGLLGEEVALGAAAAVLGWLLAGLLAPRLQFGIADVIGRSDVGWPWTTLLVTLALVVLLLVVATAVPAMRAARQPVTDVLRDVPPESSGALVHGMPGRLSLLGVREAATRPGRSLLTALAVAVAVIGALVAAAFVGAFDDLVAEPARVGDPWDAEVVVADQPWDELAAAVAATPGVESWYAQAGGRATLDGGAFLLRAIEGEPGYDVGEGRLAKRSGESIAGYGFLTRFGVDVGDKVTVDTAFGPLTSRVVGWYRAIEDTGEILVVTLDQARSLAPDAQPSVLMVKAEPDVGPEVLAASLSERLGPGVDVEPYVSDTEGLDPFLAVLWLVAILLAVVAGANLLATLLATTRESARSLGVMGSVGFTPRQLIGQGAVAAGSIALVATAVGVPVGLWLAHWLLDEVTSSIGLGPGVSKGPGTLVVVVVAVVAVAAAAALGALATARLARRPVSDLVRWE